MKVLLVREPYATLIAMGKKIIETRRYAVPKTINTSRRIGIVGCNGSQSFLLATCCIAGSFKYASREQWEKDINVHKVKPNTEFDWDDKTPRYGWLLTGMFELDVPQRFYPEAHHRFKRQIILMRLLKRFARKPLTQQQLQQRKEERKSALIVFLGWLAGFLLAEGVLR